MRRRRSRSSTATVCLILLSSVLLYPQVTPDKGKSVFEGSVRDSLTKLPIPKARVELNPLAAKQPAYAGFLTDTAGLCRIDPVVPGDYRIRARARGYADGLGPTVHLPAGQAVTTAVIELDPAAIVTGRVTDSGGEPVVDAQVLAITEQWQRGFRTYRPEGVAHTNDRGEYHLKVLPGRYYLSAGAQHSSVAVFTEEPGKPEMRTTRVVYPNALTIEDGTAVDLHPGQQLSGIAFKLPTVTAYHVRGTVRVYSPPANINMVLLRRRGGDRTSSGGGATVRKDGSFDAIGVPPGSYWLELMPLRGSPTVGRMAVEVTDHDVNGIKVPSIPQFEIKGRVRFESDGPAPPYTAVKLHLDWLDWFQFNFAGVATPDATGTFVFPSRPAGVYVISLAPESDLYIQSIWYQQRELESGRIDFSNGPAGEVDIVLGTGTGRVEGTVRYPDAVPGAPPPPLPPATRAVLVSASGVTGDTRARSAEIDQSGHFQFRFVPPGQYFAFISPQYDADLWQNADFVEQIRAGGVSVDVPKKGAATVEVPILSGDDLRRAVEKVPR